MIGEIGNQVADIARTNGKIAATEAANEKMKTAGSDARNAAISQLKKDGKEVTDQAIHDQMYQTFYNEAFNQSGMGTGQSTQRAITAATAAIQALAGGDIKAAIAGGAAPYIANAIPEKDLKGRVLAHAVVNAALAAASGRDGASAAAGAAVGELAGKIAVDGFGKQVSELSEEEKQTVSALATLASGLAGGLVGDSSANAVAAAQAGKTTVENNSLSEAADYLATGKKPEDRYKDAQQQLKDAVDEFKAKNCDGLSAAVCGAKMDAHRDELLAGFAEAGSDYIPVYGDIKSFQEADSALGYLAAVVGILPGLGDEAGAFLKGADKALKAGDLETASKLINKASNEIEAVARPSHRQSELDVGKDLGDGWREQVSFKDGKEVPYGTKGGVRPDWCQGNVCSVEVKNYNITTNKNGLINNVAKQAVERQKNLPAGMRQEVVIDIRGQKVTSIQEDAIIKGIVQKTNGAIKPTDIQFKR